MKKLFALFILLAFLEKNQAISIYVNQNATGTNMGTSWKNAYPDIQLALSFSNAGDSIFVAKGLYSPSTLDISESFIIPDRVMVFGGFSGTEDSINEEVLNNRDFITNVTILSGILEGGTQLNHVIQFLNDSPGTLLDGFTIEDGKTNIANFKGGGIYVESSTITIQNLIIKNNSARWGGGIACSEESKVTAKNILLMHNTASESGGAIYIEGLSSFRGEDIIIYKNISSSQCGGIAVCLQSNLFLNKAIISYNEATYEAAYGSGGNDTIINTSICNNISDYKPCIDFYGDNENIFINTVVWENKAYRYLPGSDEEPNAEFINSMIQGSGGSENWDTTLGFDRGNNIDVDPYFVKPIENNYSLYSCSQLLNAGKSEFGNNIGYYQGTGIKWLETIYVNELASGLNNGSDWENAYTDLQSALDIARTNQKIFVAKGIYKPHLNDRHVSFKLKSGVSMFGGFIGNETGVDSIQIASRDLLINRTVISGDLAENDDNFSNYNDNSYHVVWVDGADSATILDGFWVKSGNANGSTYPDCAGGGIYIKNGEPRILNCVFYENYAKYGGGGCISSDSAIKIEQACFINNCFINNNCNSNISSALTTYSFVMPSLINTIVWGCKYGDTDPVFGDVKFKNCIIENSGGSDSWIASTGIDMGGNIDSDPLFVDMNKLDLRLKENSMALGEGDKLFGKNIGIYQGEGIQILTKFDTHEYESFRLKIHPQPVLDNLHIDFTSVNACNGELQICNLSGETIVKRIIPVIAGQNEYQINMEELLSGIYFIQLKIENLLFQSKIIKIGL